VDILGGRSPNMAKKREKREERMKELEALCAITEAISGHRNSALLI